MSGMSEIEQVLPSQKPAEVKAELVSCASQCVRALIGHTNKDNCSGVFHTELKWDPESGRVGLIEINCRVGGGPMYNTVEWMFGNHQSLLLATLMVALRIDPRRSREWLQANNVPEVGPCLQSKVVLHSFLTAHRAGLKCPSPSLLAEFSRLHPEILLSRLVSPEGVSLAFPPSNEEEEYAWFCVSGISEAEARRELNKVNREWVMFWENAMGASQVCACNVDTAMA